MLKKLKTAWLLYRAELAAIDWGDVIVRSIKTFVEIGICYAVSALTGVNFAKDLSGTFWKGFLLSAGSAGIAAVWNSVLMPVLNPKNVKHGLDTYAARTAIDMAKANSNTQPEKDDLNG